MSSSLYDVKRWLPTSKKEVDAMGWEYIDVILFTGDAYIDHPAFGAAVIGRLLEKMGLKVAIVPQPNWRDDWRDFKKLGVPRLFFGVTAGAMDSMVNHYTANKRLRHDDAYTPGNQYGYRPDYPTVVYTKILKELFPDVPVVLGGIEASLRRVTHYDYWQDKLRPSILVDSGADMLIYGMGEQPLKELVRFMMKGIPLSNLKNIPQTAFLVQDESQIPGMKQWQNLDLHSHEVCLADKIKYAQNFRYIEEESNKLKARRLFQRVGESILVINPPYPPMEEEEMDESFDLPYTRLPHPRYHNKGRIPAYEMIKFSINSHRGCFGGCSFCTISAHQGKFIASRSQTSILKEAEAIAMLPDFKGHISDIGGPSANMYRMKGKRLEICMNCKRPSCIYPKVCSNLDTDHQPMTELYDAVSKVKGIKKVTIGSGLRYDMFFDSNGELEPDKKEYVEKLVKKYVSGRLKIAPEHTSDQVLEIMRKPSFKLFYKFRKIFETMNQEAGLKQQLIPYFISSHPGSMPEDMAKLAVETKELDFRLEQVQDFTPTPMTVATEIYYTGVHPYTLQPVFTAKSTKQKLAQRRFFFWYKREYRQEIHADLLQMGRRDLYERLYNEKTKPVEKRKRKKAR